MKLLHVGLIVPDLDEAARFYEGVLDLKRASRPDLGFEGIFYAAGVGRQIHLMKLPDPYEGYESSLYMAGATGTWHWPYETSKQFVCGWRQGISFTP